jgi:Family of unknown function (DUF6545)
VKDAAFMACSLGCWVAFGYKYLALRQAPPERKRVIRPILAASWAAASGYLCGMPVVGVNLDRLIGIPNLSMLAALVFGVTMVCALRVMILNWRHPLERARRRTRWTVLSYGLVIAAMITLFALSPTAEEHHHDFVPTFATTHYLAEFLVLFFVVYVWSLINITYLCLRWASDTPANQPWLRRGLGLTSVGILFPIGYGTISLTTVVGSWFGADLYYWGVIAPNVTGPGVPICTAGVTIAAWGPRLPSIREWVARRRADLRDYRQLRPLWLALRPIDPAMVHAPGTPRERVSIESRLFFRVIEINDWLHQLGAYRDPIVAETLARRGADLGLAASDILAAAEAANIMAALAARTHGRTTGRTASYDQSDPPVEAKHAFASERTRLVLTARAFSSPLVSDVLRNVTAAPHPDSPGAPPDVLSPVGVARSPDQPAGSGS